MRPDGNCTYHGVIAAEPDHLHELTGIPDLAPADVRRYVVAILQADRQMEDRGSPTRYGAFISAAPDQCGCAGVVNRASSSRYSQAPANSRRANICTGCGSANNGELTTNAGSPTPKPADDPS